MTEPTLYGDFIDGPEVEAALLAHLERWMPDYTGAVLRRRDPDQERWPQGIAPVETFTVKHAAAEKWPEDQLPMLLAYCPGINGENPPQEGDGTVSAEFAVTLTAISSGFDEADAKALARIYSTAARGAIMQHPDLGDFADHVRWADYRNFPVTRGVEAERSLMAVADTYLITVGNVLNLYGGPLEPTGTPEVEPDPNPTVGEGKATAEVRIL